MDPVFVRSAYNYDMFAASEESGLKCLDKSLALQSEKDDADINVIVERFGLTGSIPQGLRVPSFGDFDQVVDYQSALNVVRSAEESFLRVPAGIRARFENDPGQFVSWLEDPLNLDEARKMGLAPLAPVAAPVVAAVVPPVE